MAPDIVGHSTLPSLASHPDTSTNFSKSWTGRQFKPNTVVSAFLSISMVDSLVCEDMSASTLPTLILGISATLIQLTTDSPQSVDRGVPCHAILELLNLLNPPPAQKTYEEKKSYPPPTNRRRAYGDGQATRYIWQ